MIDLRTLRPLDDATIVGSVRRTHRAVVVDEGWRSGGISAEIAARIVEQAFWELDAPVARVCAAEVPVPYARQLEQAALPQPADIVEAAPGWWADGRVPHAVAGRRHGRGNRLEWQVDPGDAVHRGDIVAVVETEKSDIEVEVFEDGVVEELLVPAGHEVTVGTPLARIGAPGTASPTAPEIARAPEPQPEPQPEPGHHPVRSPVVRRLADELGVDTTGLTGTGPGGTVTRADVEAAVRTAPAAPAAPAAPDHSPPSAAPRLRASPLARRRAESHGIDLATVEGTGPEGAVVARDLPDQPAGTGEGAGTGDRQASLRRSVATLMSRSKREIPHYYVRSTMDLGPADAWLEAANRTRPPSERLVAAAVLLAAVAHAATRVPGLNGHWIDGGFRAADAVDLGVAISLRGGGLLAPAIRDAADLSVDELMARLRDLTRRTREGRLRASEMTDPTITVTNLGEQGAEAVYGVIYPPQVAIVGFGRVVERPWAVDGMLAVRPVVTATLSGDHRASNGHDGARFLTAVDRYLQGMEQP